MAPKDTFYNLPDEKREVIFNAALDEFSKFTYPEASVNRIVAKADISKGSFYQYFDDKADIFFHIVNIMKEAKLEYVSPVMLNPHEHDFFKLLEEMYLAGIKFAVENPEFSAFGEKMLAIKDSEIYKKLLSENSQTAADFYLYLLTVAVERGEIRDDLDLDLTAHLLWNMSVTMIEYHLENVSKDFDERVMETSLKFFDFLKKGIEKQGGLNDASNSG